jgi:hypothetical protein
MAKLLVPIAHASSGSTDPKSQKSFLASICSGHQVLITLDITPEEQPSTSIKSSNKCPLCSMIGQDEPLQAFTQIAFIFPEESPRFLTLIEPVLSTSKHHLHAIRAPPVVS